MILFTQYLQYFIAFAHSVIYKTNLLLFLWYENGVAGQRQQVAQHSSFVTA